MTLAVCVPVVGQPSETFLRRHVEELRPGGTVVLARRPAPDGWRPDVPVLWLDELLDEWGGAREQAAVAAFLAEHGVTAVLAEYLDIWLPFLPVLAAAGVRTVAHAHGYDVSQRLREEHWRRAYLDYAGVDVVTMSQVSRDRLLEVGLRPERVHVVPYGVDVPPALERPVRDPVRVLLVGRLVPKKHPVAALAACRRAVQLGARLHVTVVGDGPLREQVAAAAQDLDADLVGAAGHDVVLAAMRAADVFVQHSVVDPVTGDEEGLPVAVLEAMAHGLPVVSTRHAGIPEAVVEGETGCLVDEGDVEQMARHLAALAADPAVRQRLGAAGRARAVERFSAAAERAALRELLGCQDARERSGT